MKGFLLINKQTDVTSHDVVNQVRKLTNEKRVGHAGTLDPFATGLLIVAVTREATREMKNLVGLDKKYEATFIIGQSSDTDDKTGQLIEVPIHNEITEEDITTVLPAFSGEIEQEPPQYSAIKINGKKMYEIARSGKTVKPKLRKITIYSLELLKFNKITSNKYSLEVKIHCSTGTYIRAIARDLGKQLGTGGYVEKLHRTQIGPYTALESLSIDEIKKIGTEKHIQPINLFLDKL